MRRAALALVVPLAAAAAASAVGAGAAVPRVPCLAAIGHPTSGRQDGYRVVLGAVSVPSGLLSRIVPTHTTPWRYWRKAGLLVRTGGSPVVVSVAKAWRKRAAIAWGATGPVSALRIERCPRETNVWSAYAGGFYVRAPSCVPLVFRIGHRRTTVRFGVGRRCPASRSGPSG